MTTTTTRTTRTTGTPTVPAHKAWGVFLGWVATVVAWIAHVWVVAPARALWDQRWVRVMAWVGLLPLVWRVFKVAVRVAYVIVRFVVGPLVALGVERFQRAGSVRGSAAWQVRKVARKTGKGYRRGVAYGSRHAALVYG